MRERTLIAKRFEIRREAGSGGMGKVYESLDLLTGDRVALKIIETPPSADRDRFDREARLLAELTHPAIVKYIAHGIIPDGSRFLVMEWLDGVDLIERQLLQPLHVEECITLVRRIAGALSVAHTAGVIHRDIKPSNLILVNNDPAQVKVIDFGIARPFAVTRPLTRTGDIVGTVGYMAPEQIRGERGLDARVDVFSLGCVLFECLVGKPAFAGDHPYAIMAKVLVEDAPRLQDIRPDLPKALDTLLARMLSKEPIERPANGAVIIGALDTMSSSIGRSPHIQVIRTVAITKGEQQLVAILMIILEDYRNNPDGETIRQDQLENAFAPLHDIVEPMGGEISTLGDGSALVMLRGRGAARDQAARAATCALAIKKNLPQTRIVMATGALDLSVHSPVGQVIDNAAQLLDQSLSESIDAICIDAVTAQLLDVQFEVHKKGDLKMLIGERSLDTDVRRLLGKPTPCVGRVKELALLDALFNVCFSEPSAQVALLMGEAGVGKSRVCYEFTEKIRSNNTAKILFARGDSVYAGSTFALTSQLVKHAAGLFDSDDSASNHKRLHRYLEPLFDGNDLIRVSEFLGEMIQMPTPNEPSPQLRVARNDPLIMREHLHSAFVDWIGALCFNAPHVLILEDLHWGDLPSVMVLDHTINRHNEAPLLVLAMARPQIKKAFPNLWKDSEVQEIRLVALKRRAAEQLVRDVLGNETVDETVNRIVNRAAGNAFYLEELIRHIAEGGTTEFPETIVAMAQSRLEGLDADERRILRAASIFGETSWLGAVYRLLGETMSKNAVSEWIDELAQREILQINAHTRFSDEKEFSFRHNMLREAAYAMLKKDDRRLGHRLAAEWLEQNGEAEPLVLAEHFERGAEKARAVPYFVKEAQAALDSGDLDAALTISERGVACGAQGESLSAFYLVRAMLFTATRDFNAVAESASHTLRLAPEGSTQWLVAMSLLAISGGYGGDSSVLNRALQAFQNFQGDIQPIGAAGRAGYVFLNTLVQVGQRDLACKVIERLKQAAIDDMTEDPLFMGWLRMTIASTATYGLIDLGEAVHHGETGLAIFEEYGDKIGLAVAYFVLGWAFQECGMLSEGLQTCRKGCELTRSLGIGIMEGWTTYVLGFTHVLNGDPEQAITTLEPLLEAPDSVLALNARVGIAFAHLQAGRSKNAEREAQLSADGARNLSHTRIRALTVLAATQFDQNAFSEAVESAQQAQQLRNTHCLSPAYDSLLHITLAESLHALGDQTQAQHALREAHAFIHKQANAFTDPLHRESYLNKIPANARIQSLVQRWDIDP